MSEKNKQGGSVCLYFNKSHQFREQHDLALSITDVIESQVNQITAKPRNIIIGIIYRPPNDMVEEFKESFASLLQLTYKMLKCFLMEDFNLDLLKMEENRHIKNFTNMFSSTFYPLISRPTRITSTTAILIDNIFLNNIEENYECGISFTDLSDHLPVFLKASNLQRCKHHNAIDTKSRFLIDKTINHLCQDLELERRLEKCLHS